MAPFTRTAPDAEQKLVLLGSAARYDLSCACGDTKPRARGGDGLWIYPTALPSGERKAMLKVLQEGGCERGCAYCAQRHGGGPKGVSFGSDELASIFMQLYGAGRVFGLFLSSAIRGGPVRSMDRLLATAELLRRRHRYRGYLHLKLLPGSRPDQVERAMQLGTRVSVNLELPTARHLKLVAPSKRFDEDLLAPMAQVARAEQEGRFDRAGQTTQLVVGAAGESDRTILSTVDDLYRRFRLSRVYYSGFQPLPDTPLSGQAPIPFMREHRLYQVDFLLRNYGFELSEIPLPDGEQLDLETDPKTLWARAHMDRFPLELNRASVEELMRVPGIGPQSARRIVQLRAQKGPLRSAEALRTCGANHRIASPYLLLDGRRAGRGQQLALGL